VELAEPIIVGIAGIYEAMGCAGFTHPT